MRIMKPLNDPAHRARIFLRPIGPAREIYRPAELFCREDRESVYDREEK